MICILWSVPGTSPGFCTPLSGVFSILLPCLGFCQVCWPGLRRGAPLRLSDLRNTCKILVHLTKGCLSELRLLDFFLRSVCEIGGDLLLNRNDSVLVAFRAKGLAKVEVKGWQVQHFVQEGSSRIGHRTETDN